MEKIAISVKISKELKGKFDNILLKEHRSQAQQIEYWIENYKLNDKKEGN